MMRYVCDAGGEFPICQHTAPVVKKNGVEHTLTCKKGGYVNMRHNAIRNTEAELLKEVAYDVRVEPGLLPVGNVQLARGTNIEEQARVDVSVRRGV